MTQRSGNERTLGGSVNGRNRARPRNIPAPSLGSSADIRARAAYYRAEAANSTVPARRTFCLEFAAELELEANRLEEVAGRTEQT
jgi:hypothetical protein